MPATPTPSGAHSTAAPAPAPPTYHGPDDKTFVFHVVVFMLVLVGACTLYVLPRTISRFCNAAEWGAGIFLRSVSAINRSGKDANRNTWRSSIAFVQDGFSASPTTFSMLASHAPTLSPPVDPKRKLQLVSQFDAHTINEPSPSKSQPPRHFPAYSTHLPRVAALLRKPLTPSASCGAAFLLAAYVGVCIYALFWRSNAIIHPVRAGYVAVATLPFVVLFACKNSPVGWFVSLGYERLNVLHRVAGRALIVIATMHAFGYISKYTMTGTLSKELHEKKNFYGLFAMIWLNVMLLTSIVAMRTKAYQIFLHYHVAGYIIVIIALYHHAPKMTKYIIASAIIYGADRVLRLAKSRIVTATIRPMPELNTTKLEIPTLNSGWRPGQHVQIRVLSLGMGWTRLFEAHPFTIATAAGGSEGAVLMIKAAGAWTRNLLALSYGDHDDNAEKASAGRTVKVWVEGPYGGPGNTLYNSFSAAVLVAGGSGITYALSVADDIIQNLRAGASRTSTLELVWSIRNPSELAPLIPTFSSLLRASKGALRVTVCYTRASASMSTELANLGMELPVGLALVPGRCSAKDVIHRAADRALAATKGPCSGVIVGVAGPTSLAHEVRRAVAQMDDRRRTVVGGVELHEEVFGW